jgi:mycothione reductase
VTHFDLVIVGAGSGNSLLTPALDDRNVAIIERGDFGGTCLNRGCIPSKMLVHVADVASSTRNADRLGITASVEQVRWPEISERVFGRIDPIAAGGEEYRRSLDNVVVYKGQARFVGDRLLVAGGAEVTGDAVVLAAGARPYVPSHPDLSAIPYHTSDTIMRLAEPPRRLLIWGGGYIAAEMAHVFGAAGSEVTIVNRGPRLLRAEDGEVSEAFTRAYCDRFRVLTGAQVLATATTRAGGVRMRVQQSGGEVTLEADVLLVAAGRVPNGDELNVTAAGVALDPAGYVVTDEYGRTTAAGIWALGDICNPHQLKHVANAEARAVAHNLAHPTDLRPLALGPVPHAVFASPQVASVGLTEQALQAGGRPYRRSVRPYSDTAYGWAMEDQAGFCKLLSDPATDRLLGAHICGPDAAVLLQQLVQAMAFDLSVTQIAGGQLYIHPALSEVVEQALLGLLG